MATLTFYNLKDGLSTERQSWSGDNRIKYGDYESLYDELCNCETDSDSQYDCHQEGFVCRNEAGEVIKFYVGDAKTDEEELAILNNHDDW